MIYNDLCSLGNTGKRMNITGTRLTFSDRHAVYVYLQDALFVAEITTKYYQ